MNMLMELASSQEEKKYDKTTMTIKELIRNSEHKIYIFSPMPNHGMDILSRNKSAKPKDVK